MRIAVIGGHDRSEVALGALAKESGHELEFHTGHVGGRGANEIRSLVARADLVVVVTDVNSHGAVHVARGAARKYQHRVVYTKRFGTHSLKHLLDDEAGVRASSGR